MQNSAFRCRNKQKIAELTPVHHEVLYPWLGTDRSSTLNDDDTSDISLVPMETRRQRNIWRCADSKPKHLSEGRRLGQRNKKRRPLK
jgi:hypothetical protein